MSEIRKALEAAGEAARKALVKPPCCMEGTGCEMPPCHCSQRAAAAAVAAFLRALPNLNLCTRGVCKFNRVADASDLAAAVEKEAGHD